MAAALTFYPVDRVAVSSNFMAMQLGGSIESVPLTTTGWTVGTTAADNYSLMAYGSERLANTFSSTVLPSTSPNNTLGDSIRSENPLSGRFAAGNWLFQFLVICDSGGDGATGLFRIRLWKSRNADGSSAVEITQSTQQTAAASNMTSDAHKVCDVTVAFGAFNTINEYLFVQLAWRITDNATATAASDVHLELNTSFKIVTPVFTPVEDTLGTPVGSGSGV